MTKLGDQLVHLVLINVRHIKLTSIILVQIIFGRRNSTAAFQKMAKLAKHIAEDKHIFCGEETKSGCLSEIRTPLF